MNREELDWRRLHQGIARQAVRPMKTSSTPKAWVLDDSIPVRHGKRMPGISSHFDPTSGRHVMGQQVLTLGLSSAEGFVLLDSALFIRATRAQGLAQPFRDGRSIAAKRYRIARQQTKPTRPWPCSSGHDAPGSRPIICWRMRGLAPSP